MKTETQVGNTLVIAYAEFNENATETLENKIKSLLLRHIDTENQLAISPNQSEHGHQPKEGLD